MLECLQKVPIDEIVDSSDREPVPQFNWSPVVDSYNPEGQIFLPSAPTNEYMNTQGLTDRFNHIITTVAGEIAMGAATIRSESAFRLLMKPILGRLLPVDVENEDFWTDLETFYLPNSNIELATADDWRVAYIQLGMDTGYTQFAYQWADTGRKTG